MLVIRQFSVKDGEDGTLLYSVLGILKDDIKQGKKTFCLFLYVSNIVQLFNWLKIKSLHFAVVLIQESTEPDLQQVEDDDMRQVLICGCLHHFFC